MELLTKGNIHQKRIVPDFAKRLCSTTKLATATPSLSAFQQDGREPVLLRTDRLAQGLRNSLIIREQAALQL